MLGSLLHARETQLLLGLCLLQCVQLFHHLSLEKPMLRLTKGVQQFRQNVYPEYEDLFKSLDANGQTPESLFITCSDSRISATLLTSSQPGTIFQHRNAGAIVPRSSYLGTSEGATIEYAVDILRVKQVVVCGHSDCGAVKCLHRPPAGMDQRPHLREWVKRADFDPEAGELLKDFDGTNLTDQVKLHTVRQINKLVGYPCVAHRMDLGELEVRAWFYDVPNGHIWEYDETDRTFRQITVDGM